jgi:hypothetical protein
MKLISVQYITESSEACFFNVTFEIKPLFRQAIQLTKRAYLDKFRNNGYSPFYYWCEDGERGDNYASVVNEMILQHELNKNK